MSQVNDSLFEKLKADRVPVIIDDQEFYRVEGDILLDEDQLQIYARQLEAARQMREMARRASEEGFSLVGITEPPSPELTGISQGGKTVRWKPGLVLSYRVVRETFIDPMNYEVVVANMRQATADWEAICGVQFQHREELDNLPGVQPKGALFTVREIDTNGQVIAAAFFPNDPVSRRRVVIDPSYYGIDLEFDKVGVLRHELGHLLGFRHEHIRSGAPAACPGESLFNIVELTDYDPHSVMHYFCGNVGSRELKITDVDRTGAQKLYGPSFAGLRLVE
jgi:Matrixin